MRYLMMTTFSCVSMWMSEARRWIALKTIESTSLMIGEASWVIRSIVSVSSPSSSSETSCMRKSSVASSRTRWEDSLFCRMSSIAPRLPTLTRSGRPSRSSSSSSLTTSVGSAQMIVIDALGAALRHEVVAEHPLDRDRAEEVGVDAEGREVDVRAAPAARRGRSPAPPPRRARRTGLRRSAAWPWPPSPSAHDLIADIRRNIGR